MNKRTMDEMISYFNREVSKMDISQEYKIKLLGMITAIGYESKKQDLVRCKDCKWCEYPVHNSTKYGCKLFDRCVKGDWFCADGERR